MHERIRTPLLWTLPVLALLALAAGATARTVSCGYSDPPVCTETIWWPGTLAMLVLAVSLGTAWAYMLFLGRKQDPRS